MTKLYCRSCQVSRGWRLWTQLFSASLLWWKSEKLFTLTVFVPPPMLAKERGFFGVNCLSWYQWTEQLDLFTTARLITLIVKVKDQRLILSLHFDWKVRVAVLIKQHGSYCVLPIIVWKPAQRFWWHVVVNLWFVLTGERNCVYYGHFDPSVTLSWGLFTC